MLTALVEATSLRYRMGIAGEGIMDDGFQFHRAESGPKIRSSEAFRLRTLKHSTPRPNGIHLFVNTAR